MSPRAISPFQAVWHPELKPEESRYSLRTREIARIAWDIFSIIVFPILIARTIHATVNFCAKKMILPSAWFYGKQILKRTQAAFSAHCFGPINEHNRRFRESFDAARHFVDTPDGARLHMVHFKHKEADAKTPTVLLIPSNAAFLEQGVYSWLIEKALDRKIPCNFLVFDYRTVSRSKGDFTQIRDLVTDAESIFQFAKERLEIAPETLRLYGWSMGGGVAANLAALHPEIRHITSERSYSSTKAVLFAWMPKTFQILFFWLAHSLKRWNLEVPYPRLTQIPFVIYHREDPTIPFPASAHMGNQKLPSLELVQRENAGEEDDEIDHHFAPLDIYEGRDGQDAAETIASHVLE